MPLHAILCEKAFAYPEPPMFKIPAVEYQYAEGIFQTGSAYMDCRGNPPPNLGSPLRIKGREYVIVAIEELTSMRDPIGNVATHLVKFRDPSSSPSLRDQLELTTLQLRLYAKPTDTATQEILATSAQLLQATAAPPAPVAQVSP